MAKSIRQCMDAFIASDEIASSSKSSQTRTRTVLRLIGFHISTIEPISHLEREHFDLVIAACRKRGMANSSINQYKANGASDGMAGGPEIMGSWMLEENHKKGEHAVRITGVRYRQAKRIVVNAEEAQLLKDALESLLESIKDHDVPNTRPTARLVYGIDI